VVVHRCRPSFVFPLVRLPDRDRFLSLAHGPARVLIGAELRRCAKGDNDHGHTVINDHTTQTYRSTAQDSAAGPVIRTIRLSSDLHVHFVSDGKYFRRFQAKARHLSMLCLSNPGLGAARTVLGYSCCRFLFPLAAALPCSALRRTRSLMN